MIKYIIALIIIITIITGYSIRQFNQQTGREIEAMFSATTTGSKAVTAAMLSELPVPVQRWLNYCGVVGREEIHSVYLKQKGVMRLKPEQKKRDYQARRQQLRRTITKEVVDMNKPVTIKRVYRYDQLDRLVSVVTESGQEYRFAYDEAGNRTSSPPLPGTAPKTAADPRAGALEQQYRSLRSQLAAGHLSPALFAEKVNTELRYQDNSGRWRQIRAADGKWLVWDGQKWVEQAQ